MTNKVTHNLLLLFIVIGGASTSFSQQVVCQHYVVQDIPFCKVTLKVSEDGKLASTAEIDHQGQVFTSQIQELSLESDQRFHLYLDADKPGKEIEMIVRNAQNEKGEHKAVLINHEAPFAKEMHGICIEEN